MMDSTTTEAAPADEFLEQNVRVEATEQSGIKTEAVCGVCETNTPKYKCPRCYLPYCSVACNRTHRENHPPDPEPIELTTAKPAAASSPVPNPMHGPKNPFSALESSDQLRRLFLKYPGLPQQLQNIYKATQPPPDATDKRLPASLMQGIAKNDGWNHDMGIKHGKEALRRARQEDGEEGEAVREYTELVLHLIEKQTKESDASLLLHQQAAQKDSKLIEQLMKQEQR